MITTSIRPTTKDNRSYYTIQTINFTTKSMENATGMLLFELLDSLIVKKITRWHYKYNKSAKSRHSQTVSEQINQTNNDIQPMNLRTLPQIVCRIQQACRFLVYLIFLIVIQLWTQYYKYKKSAKNYQIKNIHGGLARQQILFHHSTNIFVDKKNLKIEVGGRFFGLSGVFQPPRCLDYKPKFTPI